MAKNMFGRREGDRTDDEYTTATAASSSSSRSSSSSSAGGLTAFIDQGSEFEGKLSFRDTVRIDGRFCGEISSENTLIVGESGEIEADIKSKTVAVSGTVTGNIIAAQKIVLHKTAKVNGNVEAPSLVVEDGACLNGEVRMTAGGSKSASALKPVSSSGSSSSSASGSDSDSTNA